MSLSSLVSTLPKYQITLPLTKTKIEYRPFLVKEEKILLMAAETKNEKAMLSAVKEIVSECTFGKIDISKLPIVDMEYLFLQLRSDSVGETATPIIKCANCQVPNEVSINLKEIKPYIDESNDKKIHLIEKIYVFMKQPSMSDLDSIKGENDMERALYMIVKCIEKVVNGETIYNASEMDPEEVRDFIENLTQSQFNKLLKFVEKMPTMQKDVHFKCKKCGHENNMVLKGLSSFFS